MLAPGLGWIASGIVSIGAWSIRHTNGNGLLYIAIFVILVGISLLAMNERIGKLIDYYKNKKSGGGN